jgi:hypothetical protein
MRRALVRRGVRGTTVDMGERLPAGLSDLRLLAGESRK